MVQLQRCQYIRTPQTEKWTLQANEKLALKEPNSLHWLISLLCDHMFKLSHQKNSFHFFTAFHAEIFYLH